MDTAEEADRTWSWYFAPSWAELKKECICTSTLSHVCMPFTWNVVLYFTDDLYFALLLYPQSSLALSTVLKSQVGYDEFRELQQGTLNYYINILVGQDSSVCIAPRYGLGCLGSESRCIRYFPHPFRPALGPTKPPIQFVLISAPHPPVLKRAGCGVDHSALLATRLKKLTLFKLMFQYNTFP